MTQIIDEIAECLRRDMPSLKFVKDDISISVPPSSKSGFPVQILDVGELILAIPMRELYGYHTHLYGNDPQIAAGILKKYLTSYYRIELVYIGTILIKADIQEKQEAAWKTISGVAFLFKTLILPLILFWRKKRTVFLQNDIENILKEENG